MEGSNNKFEEGKRLIRYSARGYPLIVNIEGERVCCLEGCYRKSQGRLLCWFHLRDTNDYSSYTDSLVKSLNEYKLINDEYYEMTVPNYDKKYKISKDDLNFSRSKNWRALQKNDRCCYLTRSQRVEGVSETVYFHVEIMRKEVEIYRKEHGNEKIPIVDHINGDPLDNRRENLRVRTASENNMNKVIVKNNTSGIAGVKWHNKNAVWYATINIDNKRIHLGSFYYFRNAVKARINAEDIYYGEHAFRRRDEEYNNLINYYLDLPSKKEPVFRARPTVEPFIHGVRKYSSPNNRNGYIVSVYNQETRETIRKTFTSLCSAIEWKTKREIEFYGNVVSHIDEKIHKQI